MDAPHKEIWPKDQTRIWPHTISNWELCRLSIKESNPKWWGGGGLAHIKLAHIKERIGTINWS